MTHPTIHPHPDQALHALESVQMVLSYSMDGLITDVNQRYLDVAGYQRSEMVGKPLSAFLPPGQSGASESFWQGLRRGEPQTGQFMRIGKSGAPYWFEGIYTPVRGRDGALEGVVLFGIDITEAKLRSAEAIDLSKALSRSQAMIEFTPEGEIVGANENFLRVMGYTLAEIKGRHHSMFLDSETVRSPEYAKFWEDLRAGQFRAGEFKRLTKGGIPAYIVASYNPVTGADGKVSRVVKYATDVTATRIAVQELTNGLARMAEGDLTVRLTEAVRGEFETVRNSFNNSLESFADMVNQVRTRAETIEVEAEAIAGGAEDMANRGENQASSLEQTAAAVEEISGNVTMTSQSARECDASARGAQAEVLKGADIVAQAISAMERIEHHTRQMGEFTRVIESFAFQTNLLSINAAVEAARAGEVGRGFAVVANEVRNLAQQSAKASQNIAELIGKSDAEVKSGVKLVRDAGGALDMIREAMSSMAQNIAGIAHATTEQATGVREVSEALSQLDEVNQANLALSNQYVGTAGAMSSQIDALKSMLERFTTRAGQGHQAGQTGAQLLPLRAGGDHRRSA